MNNGTHGSFDDHIADCLASYLESVESGSTYHELAMPETLPLEIQREIARGQQCIEILLAAKAECRATSTALSSGGRTRTIGRFEIQEELGVGGFGIVYRARDSITQRDVALKIPRLEALASAELQARFEKEARAAAKLDHPHIVPVLDAGTDGMLPYIVSQYCPGSSLASWLDDRAADVSPEQSARLVLALAGAVEHAHRRGVLHRDIKPSNVLLVGKAGGSDKAPLSQLTPKLTDFGLAKLTDAAGDLTQTGAMLGTIRYMSPEQALGRTKAIGPAADVYSLGAVLYQLLSGAPPFADYADLEVLQKIETDEPTRLGSAYRRIPIDLQTICARCLEKEPGNRYLSAQHLADDLERYLEGRPILARSVTRRERVWKWARRNPAWTALLLGAIAATAIVISALAISNYHVRQERDRAFKSEARAVKSEQLARDRELEALSRAYNFDLRQAKEYWTSNLFDDARRALDRHLPRAGMPDMREFAWWYLHRQVTEASTELGRHQGRAMAVAASPQGDLVASAGSEGLIKLWDVQSRAQIAELTKHQGKEINALAISPDGSLLASAADDGLVCLWSLPSGELKQGWRHGFGWVGAVAFSPDGKRVASAGSDKLIRIWTIADKKSGGVLKGHKDNIRAVAFVSDSALVSSSEDCEVRAWDLNRFEPDSRVPDGLLPRTHSSSLIIYDMAVDHERHLLVGAQWDNGVERWHLDDAHFGQPAGCSLQPATLRCVDLDGHHLLAVGSSNGNVHFLIFDAENQQRTIVNRHDRGGRVSGLAYLPGSRDIVTATADGAIRLHPRPTRHVPDSLPKLVRPGLSRWRGDLVISTSDHDLVVFNRRTQRVINHIQERMLGAPQLAPAASLIVFIETGRHPPVLNARSLTEKKTSWRFELPPGTSDNAVDAAERFVAVPGKNELLILDLRTGAVLNRCPHSANVDEVEFVGDSTLVATTAHDGYVRIWDAATGKRIEEHQAHQTAAKKLSVSQSGTRVLTSGDNGLSVWERPGWKKLTIIPERDAIDQVALLDDGRTVAVLFEKGLSLWRAADGAEVLDFSGDQHIDSIVANDDGQQLLIQNGEYLDILDGRREALRPSQ